LSATDPDAGNTFTYGLTCTAPGADDASFNISGANLRASSAFDFESKSSYAICVRTTDQGGLSFDKNFTVTVTNVNEAPVCNNVTINTNEDTAGTTAPNCADAENDVLTYSVVGAASNGTGSFVDPNLSYAPNANFNGLDSFTYKANDGNADSNTASVGVTVNAVNDAPTCSDVKITTNEDTTGTTAPNCADVDSGDTLTYSVVGAASNGIGSFVDPNLSYAPNANFNGADSFTYKANDGTMDSNIANVGVTVNAVNNPPTFTKGTDQTVNEDAGAQTVSGWATAIDDGDPELTQTLNFTVTGNTNSGLFSAAPAIDATTGDLTYAPTANANGSATITITLSDDGGTANGGADTSAAQTFVINVNAVNDLPSFTSSPLTSATQNAPYTYNVTTADPDTGDTLVIDASTLPAWLTFTDNHDRTATLSGTPSNSDVGSHPVVLRVTDGVIAVPVEQSFTIVVADVNDAPTFTSAPVTTAGESTPYTYNVVTADLDAADTLTISAPTLPAWLTLVDHGDRTATLSGTPNSSQVGVFSVVLEVTDGSLTASQSFDITVDNTAPQVAPNGITALIKKKYGVVTESQTISAGVTQIRVTFNQDVYNPGIDTDPHAVTNPLNYLLVRDNGDGFQTVDCKTGVDALDTAISTGPVTYSNSGGIFVSTVTINGGLPLSNGNYRLYVCGSTSIVDIADHTLELAGDGAHPGTDFPRNFTVAVSSSGGGGGGGSKSGLNNAVAFNASGLLIPVTGFAPHQTTLLPAQPADKAYKPLNEIRIEIPTLGINYPIVGVTASTTSWDLTWLKDSVAYLEGSAYPTLSGNTVLSAHVTDANNNLGPFSDIKGLQVGDKIYLHAYGQKFVYQVQENSKILPSNISAVFKHEEYNWVTLVTCEDYNAKTATYTHRRMVRAVLISVVPEK
jgi:LPXTG-site transpeptidase (sortase) family protein